MIRFEDFGHDYGRGAVLRGIHLDVAKGAINVVCGPNAAGKTTMLRSAAGLITPTEGRVLISGMPVDSIPAGRRARMLAFMSQRFDCATGFSVRRVLELGGVMVGRAPSVIREVAGELELEDLMGTPVAELSVGQGQRVALARALVQSAADGLLVLDEPLAALDPRWAAMTAALLRSRREGGMTVLLSVHELAAAARLADRILLLSGGSVVAHGPVGEVLVPDRLEEAYGVPFELLRSADGTMVPVARDSQVGGVG